ncbi:MAG: AEC family transporter [Candidatus Hadarchaeota archaeon]|nr:AEC family transporter [Candidatus Hadarchaeota archaeon]
MVILNTIVPLFGVMLIGWILRKMGVIGRGGVKTLSDYAYYIGFPILVFVSLRDIDFATLLDHKLYLVNFIAIFLIAGIAYTVTRALKFNDKFKAAFIVCALFGNTAYMGLPLNRLALGEAAMPFASIIAAIYITLTFTFGLFYFDITPVWKQGQNFGF